MVPTVVLIPSESLVQQQTHQVVVAEEQQHITLCHEGYKVLNRDNIETEYLILLLLIVRFSEF